jgi:hypothetical protein
LSTFKPTYLVIQLLNSFLTADVGLKLNQYDEDFKDDVLRFLALEKKYSKAELRKRLDQTSEWKPWKDYLRLKYWKPKDEYALLTDTVCLLGTRMGEALQSAILTRDGFISRATEEMNSMALDFAEDTGFKVQDKWGGNMLVERIFKQEHFLLTQDVTVVVRRCKHILNNEQHLLVLSKEIAFIR